MQTGGDTYLASGTGKKVIMLGNHTSKNYALEIFSVSGSNTIAPANRGIVLNNGGTPGGKFDFYTGGVAAPDASFNFRITSPQTLVASPLKNILTAKLISSSSAIGINTDDPTLPSWMNGTPSETFSLVDITGDNPIIKLYDNYLIPGNANDKTSEIALTASNGYGRLISDIGFAFFLDAKNTGSPAADFRIMKNADHWNGSEVEIFRVNNDGYVGCKGLKVTQGAFPDYVFKQNYDLMSIADLSDFIEKHHKLPGLPSADEVEKSGLDIGKITTKLVEKVEELTIYLIEIKKENESLKKIVSTNTKSK